MQNILLASCHNNQDQPKSKRKHHQTFRKIQDNDKKLPDIFDRSKMYVEHIHEAIFNDNHQLPFHFVCQMQEMMVTTIQCDQHTLAAMTNKYLELLAFDYSHATRIKQQIFQ